MEKVKFTFRVPVTIYEYYSDMAEKMGISINSAMIIGLQSYIDEVDKTKKYVSVSEFIEEVMNKIEEK